MRLVLVMIVVAVVGIWSDSLCYKQGLIRGCEVENARTSAILSMIFKQHVGVNEDYCKDKYK